MKLANRIKMLNPRRARVQRRPITPSPSSAPSITAADPVDRFLALGTEGPTLIAGRRQFNFDEAPSLMRAVELNGVDVVQRISNRVGTENRSNALVFALAVAASRGDDSTRRAALVALPRVCLTGAELLAFLAVIDYQRGWGRGLRSAIAKWYVDAAQELVANEVELIVDGWSHRDALRLAHPKPISTAQGELFGRLCDSGIQHKEAAMPVLTLEALNQEVAKWEATGRRILVAVDSTPSMRNWKVAGSTLSAAEVASTLARGIARAEQAATFVAWGATVTLIAITKRTTLDSLSKSLHGEDVGTSNPAQPIVYATNKKLPIDVFVVITDNETSIGTPHPAQALADYRERLGVDAKLIVVGLTSTGFSIAAADDPRMLDVVGFDASVPQAIREFAVL